MTIMTTRNLKLYVSRIPIISKIIDFLLLIVALIALSFTAIFIKFSVSEISANATVFYRLWIATIIFSGIVFNNLKLKFLALSE